MKELNISLYITVN